MGSLSFKNSKGICLFVVCFFKAGNGHQREFSTFFYLVLGLGKEGEGRNIV